MSNSNEPFFPTTLAESAPAFGEIRRTLIGSERLISDLMFKTGQRPGAKGVWVSNTCSSTAPRRSKSAVMSAKVYLHVTASVQVPHNIEFPHVW